MKARVSAENQNEPANPRHLQQDGERGVCGLGTCTARISRGCRMRPWSFGRLRPRVCCVGEPSEVTAACAVSYEVSAALCIPSISCIRTLSSYTPYRSLSPPTCTYSTGAARCPFSPVLLAVVASASRASLAFSLSAFLAVTPLLLRPREEVAACGHGVAAASVPLYVTPFPAHDGSQDGWRTSFLCSIQKRDTPNATPRFERTWQRAMVTKMMT